VPFVNGFHFLLSEGISWGFVFFPFSLLYNAAEELWDTLKDHERFDEGRLMSMLCISLGTAGGSIVHTGDGYHVR
jgi:hypothetical protein